MVWGYGEGRAAASCPAQEELRRRWQHKSSWHLAGHGGMLMPYQKNYGGNSGVFSPAGEVLNETTSLIPAPFRAVQKEIR